MKELLFRVNKSPRIGGVIALLSLLLVTRVSSEELKIDWNLTANPASVDLIKLKQGEIREVAIVISNLARLGIQKIESINVSCGCLRPQIDATELLPKQKATLKLRVAAGPIEKNLTEEVIIQYTNSKLPNVKYLRIPISGQVEQIAEFSDLAINIALNSKSETFERILKVVRTKSGSWSEAKVSISDVKDLAALIEKEENGISITLKGKGESLQYGMNSGVISVSLLGDQRVHLSQDVPIAINVRPPLKLSPPSVFFPSLVVGRKVTQEFEIEIEDNSIDVEALKVVGSADSIRITDRLIKEKSLFFKAVICPKSEGAFSETLKITNFGEYGGVLVAPLMGTANASEGGQ